MKVFISSTFVDLIEYRKKAVGVLIHYTLSWVWLQKVKEYARDMSEVSHLYPSTNPEFYKDIPEYLMLKRGMTEEEPITNGYWPVYHMAAELGKKYWSNDRSG